MSTAVAVPALAGLVALTLGIVCLRYCKVFEVTFFCFFAAAAWLLTAGLCALGDIAEADHDKAWAKVTAVYNITAPTHGHGAVPNEDQDAPVPVVGRVNGNPTACQAFHADLAVKVTCGGIEADRRASSPAQPTATETSHP